MKTLIQWVKSVIGIVAAIFVTGCHDEVKQKPEPEHTSEVEKQNLDVQPENDETQAIPENKEQTMNQNNLRNDGGDLKKKSVLTPEEYERMMEQERMETAAIYGPPSMLREREMMRQVEGVEEEADSKENE